MTNGTYGLLDVIQTIGVVAALVFAAWEIRARVREQRFRNYLDSISGFVDLGKLMVENPDLHALYEYSTIDWEKKEYEELSPREKALVHYCDTIIALCETVWVAGIEGWVPKDEWPYWKRWTDQLNNSPAFRWTLNWVQDDYAEEFIADLRPNPAVKG